MYKCFFLIFYLAVASCRPQYQNEDESSIVEVEKQDVVELTPESRQLFEEHPQKHIEDHTKEILAKIAQVNERQGLNKKKSKPLYQFPFSYLRSQAIPPTETGINRQSTDFKFPRDPFSNPIFEYVEAAKGKNKVSFNDKNTPSTVTVLNSEIKPDEKIDPSDVIPGQYIKRKIVHQQSILVPNPMYFSGYNPSYNPIMAPNEYMNYGNFYGQQVPLRTAQSKDTLEQQTVENIKNIIGTSQYPPAVPYNPYTVNQQFYYPYYPITNYQTYASSEDDRPGRQFQSPLGQYFPIMIRDPLVQLFNAMTSMVEYGPGASSAGGAGGCKNKKKPMTKDAAALEGEEEDEEEKNAEVVEPKEAAEVENNEQSTVLEIEDLQIGNNETSFRQSKHNEVVAANAKQNASKTRSDNYKKKPLVQAVHLTKPNEQTKNTKNESVLLRQSPPIRDQILSEDEVENEEADRGEDIQITNDGTKKVFSKDNTGSGIFIHKLKVRKGGVAIAGPGGIATAGSGGTAIVGPNGYAYTHPDSLAIAGTGTKVISVDPSINLADIVNESNKNKTRGQVHHPRVGKVVAVGPVIYYNKG